MIRSGFISVLFVAGLALGGCSPAQKASAPQAPVAQADAGLRLDDPWAAVTPGGATVAAGFVTIANGGGADRLVGAESGRAGRVEIHEMASVDDVMRMRKVDALDVPAGGAAELSAGGSHHLMFFDITAPFEAGQTVPVTLVFEKAGRVEATFAVRPRNAAGGHDGHDKH